MRLPSSQVWGSQTEVNWLSSSNLLSLPHDMSKHAPLPHLHSHNKLCPLRPRTKITSPPLGCFLMVISHISEHSDKCNMFFAGCIRLASQTLQKIFLEKQIQECVKFQFLHIGSCNCLFKNPRDSEVSVLPPQGFNWYFPVHLESKQPYVGCCSSFSDYLEHHLDILSL